MTSPFNWRSDKSPSIFATDTSFTGKSNGKTVSELASEAVEKQRLEGKRPGTLHGLSKEYDEVMLAREHYMHQRYLEDTKNSGRSQSMVAVRQIGPESFAEARKAIAKARRR